MLGTLENYITRKLYFRNNGDLSEQILGEGAAAIVLKRKVDSKESLL